MEMDRSRCEKNRKQAFRIKIAALNLRKRFMSPERLRMNLPRCRPLPDTVFAQDQNRAVSLGDARDREASPFCNRGRCNRIVHQNIRRPAGGGSHWALPGVTEELSTHAGRTRVELEP